MEFKSQKATGSSEEIKQINSYLKTLEQDIYSAHQLLVQQSKTISAESIKNKLLGKDQTTHMLIEIIKDHNRKMAAVLAFGIGDIITTN